MKILVFIAVFLLDRMVVQVLLDKLGDKLKEGDAE